MVLTDTQRALLGDRSAQERITERGELLPCPFCGGNAELKRTSGGYSQNPVTIMERWEVRCKNRCTASNSFCSKIYQNDAGILCVEKDGAKYARIAWNTRAPILPPEKIKRLEELG